MEGWLRRELHSNCSRHWVKTCRSDYRSIQPADGRGADLFQSPTRDAISKQINGKSGVYVGRHLGPVSIRRVKTTQPLDQAIRDLSVGLIMKNRMTLLRPSHHRGRIANTYRQMFAGSSIDQLIGLAKHQQQWDGQVSGMVDRPATLR